MEERVARLEANVEHIRSDTLEIKTDIRQLNSKVDSVKESIASLKMARMVDRVWWLLIAGALLSVMARGFKWI